MILSLKDVALKKDGNWILSDVNWEIDNGDHWVLLGLNGAGKTALLHMLGAYYFPTKGSVTVLDKTFGKDVLGESLRQQIGIVSASLKARMYEADTAYHIALSGGFASIGLYETPTDEMRKKAKYLLKQMGCLKYGNRSYRTLSQGEQQRVLIARALMADPKLLILDEPTSGLDFIAREQLLEAIEKITMDKDSPTVIYVTHHVDEILPTFNKTLLLKDGTVFSQGDTSEMITTDHLTEFFGVPVEVDHTHKRPLLRKK
ncbi:ABC transporter ATP-binding protein [Saliterribacillus persicus]|uniref:Iron complex transport system ATP-binding protein n=1 Tax=Saliterribacillus persicus TaxID=930114 RepID=A0A368Y096_9BACI|nr:ABC transporter ATP-binding protein [Saliterribacillus persicus]RCW73119.1 iron complex transport system ATP-binding protein [Saliterribacillus persicus]